MGRQQQFLFRNMPSRYLPRRNKWQIETFSRSQKTPLNNFSVLYQRNQHVRTLTDSAQQLAGNKRFLQISPLSNLPVPANGQPKVRVCASIPLRAKHWHIADKHKV